jgi:SAM-dependent methyltransferase
MTDRLVTRAADYYSKKLAEHGATPRGADWNTVESQYQRFEQLLRVCRDGEHRAINDYGCGYGALATFLRESKEPFDYCGFDASPSMIEAARIHVGNDPRCRFTSERGEVSPRAFTMVSGIFNVREDTSDADWWAYILRTIDDVAAMSTVGFSCNFLTSYSDADRKRPDLFYADPSEVLRHCLTRFSRHAAILHDYALYEFTLLVRL